MDNTLTTERDSSMKTFLTACMESSSRRKEAPASSRRVCNIPRSLSLLTSAATVATGVVKHARRRTSRLTALLLALLWSSAALPALAATITVTNNADSGDGSLRQAILDSAGNGIINFHPSLNGQTIALTSGQLLIDRNLTITGPGATNLAINGNQGEYPHLPHRVFECAAGATATISGLTISTGRDGGTNGRSTGCYWGLYIDPTPGGHGRGGGILNNGYLTLSNCVLSGNAATGGSGGLGNLVGECFGHSIMTGGERGGDGKGGAIFNAGTLALFSCTLSSNTAVGGRGGESGEGHPYAGGVGGSAAGGAIYSAGAFSHTIVLCTFAGNTALGGSGSAGGSVSPPSVRVMRTPA